MEKKNLKKVLIAMIIALVVMGRSLVTYVFQIPNGFAPGGVSGIATIIYNIVNIVPHAKIMEDIFNPSIVIFVINIPLLVLAFIYVNKKYAFATMIAVLIYAGSIKIFELVSVPQFTATNGATGTDFNTFVSSAGLKILSALIGGVLDGFCLGMLFKLNASAGGTEIISMIVYKKRPTLNIAWILFIMDFSIAFLSGLIGIAIILSTTASRTLSEMLVLIAAPIMYSSIALFLSSKVADFVNNGLATSMVFNIVTTKPEEISQEIIQKLHRGATILTGEGAYTKADKKIVVCIVSKKQSAELKAIAKTIDENSFTYVMRASEVRGKGFEQKNQ